MVDWEINRDNYRTALGLYSRIRELPVCGAFLECEAKRKFLREELGIKDIDIRSGQNVQRVGLDEASDAAVNDQIIFLEEQFGLYLAKCREEFGTKEPCETQGQLRFDGMVQCGRPDLSNIIGSSDAYAR